MKYAVVAVSAGDGWAKGRFDFEAPADGCDASAYSCVYYYAPPDVSTRKFRSAFGFPVSEGSGKHEGVVERWRVTVNAEKRYGVAHQHSRDPRYVKCAERFFSAEGSILTLPSM